MQFFYMLFAVVPHLLLCYVPFTDKLVRPMKRIIVEATLIYAVILVPFCVLFAINGFDEYGFGSSLLYIFVFFVYFLKTVKEKFQKPTFVFFVIVHLVPVISGVEHQLQLWLLYENYNFRVIDIIVRIVTIPLIWLAIHRLFAPRLKRINPQNAKGLWFVPVLFFTLAVILSSAFSYLTDTERSLFQVVYYPFNIVAFFVYALLLRMLDNAAENAALERTNQLRAEMITTISHEVRTPLAVLASYASLIALEIQEKNTDSQTAADLDKIAHEAVRVANLINSMKNLPISKDKAARRTAFNIGKMAEETANLYRHILERLGVALVTDIPDDLPPVFGNPEELTQVIFNLLQNAKNHTDTGEVSVKLKIENETIKIIITDTGTGIESEILPNVFERGVTGRSGGSGIGLAVCKEIVTAHNGDIFIESEQGSGTAVTFTLPICKEGEADE